MIVANTAGPHTRMLGFLFSWSESLPCNVRLKQPSMVCFEGLTLRIELLEEGVILD
jgi:hypothetical protein